MFWLLVLTWRMPSLTAAPQTDELDVWRIDAFVRNQVERHGLSGLALAEVEADQIVHLVGYGQADQSGRVVTLQTPLCWPQQ